MTNHELAFCGCREGAAQRFFGPPNVSDVWPVKKVSPNKMIQLPGEVFGHACGAVGRVRPSALKRSP